MDLSIEFHHPAISKIHNGMISNQLESDNTKKQLSSDRKVWKTISTESYIKPNTIQLSEKRDNEVVTKVPGIEVKSEIQSSFNFGNITFSDTNVIHHKKENRFIGIHNNNMFLTDGVKIVPHHFVKNFIENMKSRENGTTVAPPSIPNSSEYQESSTWNTPATTLLNAQTNGKTGETVTKITTDLSQTSPETETKLNITVTQNVTTKMHQTSPENTVTSSKPITSSTIINFTSRKPTNLEPSDNSTGANITKKERESTTAPFSRANDVNNKTPITTVQNPENISKTTTEFKTNDVTKTTENVTLINKVERTSPVLNNPVVYPTTSTTIVPNDDEDELGLHSSGSDVMPNNVNNTKIKDVDTIIFPSFRADIRQRRRERKKFCYRIGIEKTNMKPPVVSPDAIRKFIDAMKNEIDKIKHIGEKLPTTQKSAIISEAVDQGKVTTSENGVGSNGNTTPSVSTEKAVTMEIEIHTEQSTQNSFTKRTTGMTTQMTTDVKTDRSVTKGAGIRTVPTKQTTDIATVPTSKLSTEKQKTSTKHTIDSPTNISPDQNTKSQTVSATTVSPDPVPNNNQTETVTSELTPTVETDSIRDSGPTSLDLDKLIFPSHRVDNKLRKKDIRKFCNSVDFGKIKKSFQCCKKTLNCFDDLPENLDETVFHHGTHEYNEPERRHVCSHIDESIKCKQTVEIKPHCKEAADILDEKIKPQMDKVKLFYYNHCNRGSPISPTLGPKSPTLAPSPPTGQGNGSEHYHSNSSNFAPFIGGAVMGVFGLIVIVLIALYCRKSTKKRKRNKEQRNDPGRESTQSSRYKTVTYERRKSEVYAEIDEKSMISSVSYALDGHSCSTDIVNLSQTSDCKGSRKYPSAPTIRQVELDNHGYLSPQSIIQEDCLKPDVIPNENNLFTHGYIELKSESGDSAQSYAKLEPEPEDEYVSPDQIQSSPSKDKKPDQRHTYFVLEKENE